MWGKFIFREIVPQERLVFVDAFSDAEGGLARHPMSPDWPLTNALHGHFRRDGHRQTTVTIQWVPYEATEIERETFEKGKDSMQGGWTGTLDQLDDYLAQA